MVTDTLSHMEVISYITVLSKVILDFNDLTKQIVGSDASYEKLRQ